MIEPSLKQLHVFASVARHENLGDAAFELCLSKGAVSQALSELERRLATPLFDRVHPRLKLNEQGRDLQPLAEDILDRMQDIQHLFDASTTEHILGGTLRLGASQTIGNYVLPGLLADVPHIQAQVQISNTHTLCHMLSHFELDMALIEGKNHLPELTTRRWLDDEMLIVAAPTHPLAGQTGLRVSDLSGYDWVLRELQSGSREQFDQELGPLVLPLGRVQILNTLEAVMLAVEHGLGLTFISQWAAQDRLDRNKLVALDIGQKFTRQLSLVWHRQKYHGAVLRHFVAFVLEKKL